MGKIEIRKTVDLRSLLTRAADALQDAADVGGASNIYRSIESELREVIWALDQEVKRD
jgi:hypothetical protein